MPYQCPHCGTHDINLEVPVMNVIQYQSVARVAAPCCKKPIQVHAVHTICLSPFETDSKEDDWGEPYYKK